MDPQQIVPCQLACQIIFTLCSDAVMCALSTVNKEMRRIFFNESIWEDKTKTITDWEKIKPAELSWREFYIIFRTVPKLNEDREPAQVIIDLIRNMKNFDTSFHPVYQFLHKRCQFHKKTKGASHATWGLEEIKFYLEFIQEKLTKTLIQRGLYDLVREYGNRRIIAKYAPIEIVTTTCFDNDASYIYFYGQFCASKSFEWCCGYISRSQDYLKFLFRSIEHYRYDVADWLLPKIRNDVLPKELTSFFSGSDFFAVGFQYMKTRNISINFRQILLYNRNILYYLETLGLFPTPEELLPFYQDKTPHKWKERYELKEYVRRNNLFLAPN